MSPVVDNESQLHTDPRRTLRPVRTVALDIYDNEHESNTNPSTGPGCGSGDSCCCDQCSSRSTSLFGAAACVMVGASTHASERSARKRLGAQVLHWGVLFVAILFSIPIVVPTLSPVARDWVADTILNSPSNWVAWALTLFASSLFAFGFVNRLGRERVLGGCAMLRRLGPAAILGVAWSTIPSFAGVMLVLNMEPIRLALVGDGTSAMHSMIGMSIYLVGFVILAGFGCLPTVSQAILAGYAFGLPIGLGLALLGFGGASIVGYELVGRVARQRVENEIVNKPKAKMIRDALLHASPKRALLIVTLFRASPSAPFALTNLLLGSIGVSRWVFFFGTVLGMLPRTFAAVLIGRQFTGWNGHIDKPAWVVVVAIIAIIALIVLISKVASNALLRVARSESDTDTKTSPTESVNALIEPKPNRTARVISTGL